ncbi:hypothetical protein Btru_013470 [Bulinus truncatus]|nr:hypothetical protein Btru_013470 [Bulinus truncatus]
MDEISEGTRFLLREKVPSDATFLGTQYFSYNLSSKGDGVVSNQDQIMLDFRTKQASSLLFYTVSEPIEAYFGGCDYEPIEAYFGGCDYEPIEAYFGGCNAKDYITAGLIDGGIFLTVNLGSGQFEASIRPADARFDDNRWHQLVIKREAKEVSDGVKSGHL